MATVASDIPRPIERQPTGLLDGVPEQDPLGPQRDGPPDYDEDLDAGRVRRKLSMGERFHRISSATGRPVNKAAHVFGAEGPWPDTLGRECAKAARILYSFTALKSDAPPKKGGPLHPTGLTKKSVVKIPKKILQNCHGLAIFNTMRAGAWHGSLSGGSGVVVARRPDGTWSPPSAFLVSTLGAGFMLGLDVYDCVCVLNTPGQVAAFMSPRLSLGGNLGVTLGPVGTGGAVNAAVHKSGPRPAFSYMKSRGLFAGVQVDGTVFVSRGDANALFYAERGISVKRILTGDMAWPAGARPLHEVLKLIDGRIDYDRLYVQDIVGQPVPKGPWNDSTDNTAAEATGETGVVQAAPGGAYSGETGILDEKQEVTDSWVEVDSPLPSPTKQRREDDLYSTSTATDKKERRMSYA